MGRIVYVHPTADERNYLRLLLNSARGPTCYEDIRTVNGATYPTFKQACYSLGLLNHDKEWNDAIKEAQQRATPNQLRELFVTILIFCEVSDQLQFWKINTKALSEDILMRRRKLYKHPDLELSEKQLQTICLI